VAVAKQIVANRKALILVPSNRRAKEWENLVLDSKTIALLNKLRTSRKHQRQQRSC
jgi:hypothetical protein